MTEKIKKETLIPMLAAGLLFIFILGSGLGLNAVLDDPESCSSCHEMQYYYDSYKAPENHSLIASHDLNCLQCHANKSIAEAKEKVLMEMMAHKLGLPIPVSGLDVNCTGCHRSISEYSHNDMLLSNCTYCHWAHKPAKGVVLTNKTLRPDIPYGTHMNLTCLKCHGTSFEIPRCTGCHAGHGEQKFDNRLCLSCHVDPHVPVKPGILSGDTVPFPADLPFSACQPCHEDQYINLTYSLSNHRNMQTCTLCHSSHGMIPRCRQCHPGMAGDRHKDFKCVDCHLTARGVVCQDCHGRSHDWSAFTAVMNPK